MFKRPFVCCPAEADLIGPSLSVLLVCQLPLYVQIGVRTYVLQHILNVPSLNIVHSPQYRCLN